MGRLVIMAHLLYSVAKGVPVCTYLTGHACLSQWGFFFCFFGFSSRRLCMSNLGPVSLTVTEVTEGGYTITLTRLFHFHGHSVSEPPPRHGHVSAAP
jgi:hypothetical protein